MTDATGSLIELELPTPITENLYRRFVPGMRHPIICAAGRKYHEIVKNRFAESGQPPIPGGVAVSVEFYPPDRRRRDIDNPLKCLLDSIVKAGCIEDDSRIGELHAYKREPIGDRGGLTYLRIAALVQIFGIREMLRAGDLAGAVETFGIEAVARFCRDAVA